MVETTRLGLKALDLEADKLMTGRTFLGIFAGQGANNLQVIDDFAVEVDNTVATINEAIENIRDNPSTVCFSAAQQNTDTYSATVPALTGETDLVSNGLYVIKLDVTNQATTINIRINDTFTKTVKKVNGTGAVSDVAIGDVKAGQEYLFRYDGVNLVLICTDALSFAGHNGSDFVLKTEVVNNLTSTDTDLPLAANQGKVLKDEFDAQSTLFEAHVDDVANPHSVTKAQVGLNNVDNTSDASKPVSTATQAVLDTKAPINNPTFTGTVGGITKTMVGLGNVDNTSDVNKPVSSATQLALDAKAPVNNPTFTGTVSGITKEMVGLGNVENIADTDKPVSTAVQTALDEKASAADLTTHTADTTNPHSVTKTQVGLGNVDNTADADKPISTAVTAALADKASAANLTAHTGNGDVHVTAADKTAWDDKVDKATGTLAFTFGRDASGIYVEF